MPLKSWALAAPASRGIGLQLARHLLKTTNIPVVATARSRLDDVKEEILDGLKVDPERLTVLKLDVLDESSISAASSCCKSLFPSSSHYLRLAFSIPGILHPERSPAQVDYGKALQTFKTNTLGPLLLIKHFSSFLPHKSTPLEQESQNHGLPSSAVFALMSARVGSISDNSTLGGWYSYRASKAGVNQLARTFDIGLKQSAGEKAMCVALHPGTVKTGLSEEFWGNVMREKLFSAEFAAERLCEVVRGVGLEGRGRCWDWEGKEILP